MPQTGQTHARRGLVEGAWAYRSPATVRRPLPRRLAHQPKSMQDSRWQAPVRLCQRSQRLVAQGQHAHVVTGAIARELVGLVGAMATEVPLTL
jgi:transposase